MEMTVYIASAFTKNHGGGNKAGVVFLDSPLTTKQKKDIAKQLGFSETAFVSESENADFNLAYFTPTEEVDLCGHATIATFTILKYLNKLSKTAYTIETNSGILNIMLKGDSIFMEQNPPTFYEELPLTQVTNVIHLDAVQSDAPIQIVSTGLRDILVPIKNIETLSQLTPDFEVIKELSSELNVIGMHLFAITDNQIICRNFAPLYDINEESATGTSNAALACYLYTHNILRQNDYVFEQGYALNAPSEIKVHLTTDAHHQITNVQVGGNGDFIEQRTLTIN